MSITPKAFISYSWTTPAHTDRIRAYAERLVGDGVDVVLDQWGLTEGQDKYAFMEKMVTDPSVTHVLVFCDRAYAEKSDARKAGVGTESQIMSKEIYDKVDQKKFIPVVCERREDGEPFLPAFFHPRIFIDFSSPEKVNENWERLIRAVYDKPVYVKPALGKAPSYLASDSGPSLPTAGKFASLKQAIFDSRLTIPLLRSEFLDAAFEHADALRINSDMPGEPDEVIYKSVQQLLPLRDQFVDWMLLELQATPKPELADIFGSFLERLLALQSRPNDLTQWNEWWFESHMIFVHEVFLYAIAAVLKVENFTLLRSIFETSYMLPDSRLSHSTGLVRFPEFRKYPQTYARRNERLKLNRLDVIADSLHDRASRSDLPFTAVMQADLFAFVASLATHLDRWYPITLIYAGYVQRFPVFAKAAQHRYFHKFAAAFGVSTGDELRTAIGAGFERTNAGGWKVFNGWHSDASFTELSNVERWDSVP